MTGTVVIKSEDSRFRVGSTDPSSFGRDLAALGRVHRTVFDEYMGALLVLRYEDVSAALRDHRTFSTSFYGVGPMASMMIAHDGERHARERRVHNRFFSPAASARYAARVVPIAERVFAGLAGADSAELVEDVLARYPMEVFLDLLGIPGDLGDQGLEWVRAIVTWAGSPMNEELAEPGWRAFEELRAYAAGLVAAEHRDPGDSLLGEIVRAYREEECFTFEDCAVAVVSLLLGGLETTIQMLSATISSLLLNPAVLDEVVRDRDSRDAAVGEAFRWANPSAGLYRLVLSDTEIGGTAVSAGQLVYLVIAAAHFDERAYPRPTVFELGRTGGHLGFGLGPHYCLGAPLAHIEVRAALDALLDRFPRVRLARPVEFRYGARGFVQHGARELPVRLRAWS